MAFTTLCWSSWRQRGQQGGRLVARLLLQRREHRMPGLGQLQQALPRIGRRRHARQPALAFKAPQDAAQIARVQRQVAPQLGGRRLVAVGQLVQHPHLGQRELAAQVGSSTPMRWV
jgi:hypothetical protein